MLTVEAIAERYTVSAGTVLGWIKTGQLKAVNVGRALGLDLDNVSCAFLAPAIMRDISANGRAFLRNVRHGLFLLPFAVKANIGIGCPVDPGFALGGERHKNPYGEKLALAEANGLELDDTLWTNLKDRT